jgi:hypothetical protein
MPGTRLDGSCREVSDGRTTQQDDNLGSAGFGGKCQIDVVFQVWSTTTQSRKMDVDCVCCARAETVFQPQAHGSLVGLARVRGGVVLVVPGLALGRSRLSLARHHGFGERPRPQQKW